MDPFLAACLVIFVGLFTVLAIIKMLQASPIVVENRTRAPPRYNHVDPHITKTYRGVINEIPSQVHRTTIIDNPPLPRRTTVVRHKTTRYIPDLSPPVPKKRVVTQTAPTKRRVEPVFRPVSQPVQKTTTSDVPKRECTHTAPTKRRIEEPPQTVSPKSPQTVSPKNKPWWSSDSGDCSWSSRKKKSTSRSFAKTKRR